MNFVADLGFDALSFLRAYENLCRCDQLNHTRAGLLPSSSCWRSEFFCGSLLRCFQATLLRSDLWVPFILRLASRVSDSTRTYRAYTDELIRSGIEAYPALAERYVEAQTELPSAILPPTRFLYLFSAYLWHAFLDRTLSRRCTTFRVCSVSSCWDWQRCSLSASAVSASPHMSRR